LTQVEGLAARQPLLVVFEDIHWSDPTTRELLDLIIDLAPKLKALVTITFRPEFTPPWLGRPHVTMLNLNRLPPRQRTEMITHVTGGKALPNEIADQIVDRTDGVPLFIEELTKSVVESGIVKEIGDHYAAAGPVAPLAIPTSLHASLLARLDRLAPTREVAQIGAALGRSFSHELISAVAQIPTHKLDHSLAQLVGAELIFRRGTPPDAEYTFKHALVQDAAYSTLLRSHRQQLHARIATILESRFRKIAINQPAILALHCTEAGLNEKAVYYRLKAGQQAVACSAMAEAISQLRKGLERLAEMPETSWRLHKELDLQIWLGPALNAAKGYSSPDVGEVYARARALAEQLNHAALFLVGPNADLLFYNEPAENILGRRFDERGPMSAKEWSSVFTPEDSEGHAMSPEDVPLMITITKKRPAYKRFFIRGLDGVRRHVEVASIPIAGLDGEFLGGAALFWEVSD
jgi:predicted ATPase